MTAFKPFKWNGKLLRTREDFEAAFCSVTSKSDAIAMLEFVRHDLKDEPEKAVGYLIGEVPFEEWHRVATIFNQIGIVHPFCNRLEKELTPKEVAEAGFAFGQTIKAGGEIPIWLQYVLSIPRKYELGTH